MRKIAILFVAALLAASASSVRAADFTHFTQNEFFTAESLDPGMTQTGIFFTLGDHYKNYYPEIRYGLGALFEAGLKIGATSAVDPIPFSAPGGKTVLGNKLGLLAGVDLKYQLIKETEGVPLDMAIDLGYDTVLISGENASELTFATVFSKGFPLTERGYKFTPYIGLEMAALYGSMPPSKDTRFYGFGGLEWRLTQKFMVMLEFKGGKSDVGGIGIRFEY